MIGRTKPCRIVLADKIGRGSTASRWTELSDSIEIEVATAPCTAHDLVLELLLCVGQALWERIDFAEESAWLRLLQTEIEADVPGEIDDDALRVKRTLLSSPLTARSTRQLRRYARASFASTLTEYVHCLWHDVTVRVGDEHLPADCVRRRLELMARWFPPNRGYRLFPRR